MEVLAPVLIGAAATAGVLVGTVIVVALGVHAYYWWVRVRIRANPGWIYGDSRRNPGAGSRGCPLYAQ